MSLLDDMPPEIRNELRNRAEQDLQDIRHKIGLLVAEAKTRNSFDEHMSLMASLMIKFVNDPITLSMLLGEAVFMLADLSKDEKK